MGYNDTGLLMVSDSNTVLFMVSDINAGLPIPSGMEMVTGDSLDPLPDLFAVQDDLLSALRDKLIHRGPDAGENWIHHSGRTEKRWCGNRKHGYRTARVDLRLPAERTLKNARCCSDAITPQANTAVRAGRNPH